MTEKHFSDTEKLQMLLGHWLQHNKSHGKEYAQWAQVARDAGLPATAEYIEKAIDLLGKADRAFEKALQSVGGPGKGQQHHHHHGA